MALRSNFGGVFLSFEDLGKEVPDKDAPPEPAEKKAEADKTAEAVEAKRFAFLPELALSEALKERADSFRSMQSEARHVLLGRPDIKGAKDRAGTPTARTEDADLRGSPRRWEVTFQQQLQQFYASHAWRFASDGLKEDWAQLHEEYQLLFEKHLALFIRAHGMRQKEFAMLTNRSLP
eukprot:g32728.t1